MSQLLKHISLSLLLLFTLSIGAKGAVAYDVWQCAQKCISESHHQCCDCEEHEHDCDYHDKALEGECRSHVVDSENVAIQVESKVVSVLKVITLVYITTSNILSSQLALCAVDDYGENRGVDYTTEWICDVGTLRAPPVC